MEKTYKLKDGAKPTELLIMQPSLVIAFGYLLKFCQLNDLPCVITNVSHEFKQSISKTHIEGRALDISIKNWSSQDIRKGLAYVRKHAKHLGAFSKKTGRRNIIMNHTVGLGDHIHLQTAPENLNKGL